MAKKLVKKKWIEIAAPAAYNREIIGESYVADPSSLIGRSVVVNMIQLTNDPKKQNMNVRFDITGVEEGRASTEIVGYDILPSTTRRFVRKDKGKIDQSYLFETADKKIVRIKPFLMAKSKPKSSILTEIRNKTKENIERMLKKMKYDELVDEILSNKFQKTLKGYLNKIYPIRICEIRSMSLETEKKFSGKAEGKKAEKAKEGKAREEEIKEIEEEEPEELQAEEKEEAVEEEIAVSEG